MGDLAEYVWTWLADTLSGKPPVLPDLTPWRVCWPGAESCHCDCRLWPAGTAAWRAERCVVGVTAG